MSHIRVKIIKDACVLSADGSHLCSMPGLSQPKHHTAASCHNRIPPPSQTGFSSYLERRIHPAAALAPAGFGMPSLTVSWSMFHRLHLAQAAVLSPARNSRSHMHCRAVIWVLDLAMRPLTSSEGTWVQLKRRAAAFNGITVHTKLLAFKEHCGRNEIRAAPMQYCKWPMI